MGGFMLSANGEPLYTFQQCGGSGEGSDSDNPTSLVFHIRNKMIAAPTTTKEEIEDKSKGDVISKTVVILQTTWFFAQCMARWANGLPVTQLEVVALGFVALNGLTYAFWWDKPQNVGVPIYLEWIDRDRAPPEPVAWTKDSFFRRQLELISSRSWNHTDEVLILLSTPFRPLLHLLTSVKLRGLGLDTRVPMFHSNEAHDANTAVTNLAATAIAVGFGAIHLAAAWFVLHPSRVDMWLWRISAIVITGLPPMIAFLLTLYRKLALDWGFYPFYGVVVFVSILYIASRAILLTLAFFSLRHLPEDALKTIRWLSYIPHF